ncbi:TLC-domain-containing protein [Coleophoma crateriformis]|uniref:TLC-domain-containing protein n=1 Tax=Coleophoma crateriformis TaxID=565419 RepID=A0A3D8RJL0_9HELO|nr:TLC-domain-containing protein [Coleophoma crateriformis]
MASLKPLPLLNASANRLQSTAEVSISRRLKKSSKHAKSHSLLHRCEHFAINHSWTFPLVILFAIFFLYAINPNQSSVLHHFIFLSYELPLDASTSPSTPPQYGKGLWDIAFVSFYTVLLSFTREFIMQEILRPLARYFDIKSRSKQLRFMEQMYTAIYFVFLGPAGMHIMSRTPVWYFSTRGMYESFPHKTHEALFKLYYLFQAAYWAQQAIVLLLGQEKRRKDFKELVGHHIVTLALIFLSYRFHFTYMGLAIYVTHDISDFFLATSKTLNYLGSPIEGPFFVIFMSVWIYMRHYLNLRIILSLFTEFKTVGPYELNWETQQYKCLLSNVIAFWLLSALQVLNLIWLFYVLRVGYRFIVFNVAKDDRSDAEDSEFEGGGRQEGCNIDPAKKVGTHNLLSGIEQLVLTRKAGFKSSGTPTATSPTKRKEAL